MTSLFSATITSPTFTFTATPTLLSVLPAGQVACRFLQNVYINKFITGTEVSIKLQATLIAPSSQVYTYNKDGNFFNQYTLTPTTTLVDFVPLERTIGQYTWQGIAQTGISNTISSFGISQTNPNLIFALDNTGACFRGDLKLTPTPTIAFSPFVAMHGNSATINVLPQPISEYDTTILNFDVSSQTAQGTVTYGLTPVVSIARNAISSEFLVSAGGTLTSLSPLDFSQTWTNSTITGLNAIYSKNGEDVDAGDFSIYDFQVLIDAINVAFEEAYAKVPSGIFSQAPKVTLNFQTGLATLEYSSDYTPPPANKGILMNNNLHQLLYFFSTVDDFNPNYFLVTLPSASTSITQNSKSLYLFNQLDKILFISNTIFVFGSYFGANNTNNIISDIDVITNDDGYMNNLGQVVYYQPNFLRPFILNSQNPISRIQVQVWYSTLNGEQYQLQLVPSGNWNGKLIFSRRY